MANHPYRKHHARSFVKPVSSLCRLTVEGVTNCENHLNNGLNCSIHDFYGLAWYFLGNAYELSRIGPCTIYLYHGKCNYLSAKAEKGLVWLIRLGLQLHS